jgi:hypothetical protein
VLALVTTSGCFAGVGPEAIRIERPDYNRQISRSADRELLLNLVRLRYNESPLFLELGAVVTQYGYTASLAASGHFENGASAGNATTGLGYSESPTVTYTPLAGEEFATRMLSPISLDAMLLFEQNGWSAERLLLVGVQRVNDVFNAQTASGPTPDHAPDYQAFAELAERLQRLRLGELFGLNWEKREHEKQPPGRNPRFWVRMPSDPRHPLAADVAAVRRLLELKPGRDEFTLTAFPFERRPTEVGVRCRSLLGVLYFLSTSVEVPAPDVEAGLVTVTKDEQGRPFDWSTVTRKVMTVHSQREAPEGAYLAVQHRDWWFYIADDDQSSKATFSLLNILFSLQSASGKGKSPLLTLPVGK